MVDDPVHGGLAGVKQRGQRAGGQVGAQVNQHQQHPDGQRRTPGAAAGGPVRELVVEQREDAAELVIGQAGERQPGSVSAR